MASSMVTASKVDQSQRKKGVTTPNNCSLWIKRNYEVSTLKLLQHSLVNSSEFINFATIVGPARQGKSFLMNCLIGEDVFGTADTIGVCTKGVQVANVVQQVKNGGCALFVDTEGQGDEDIDSDSTLLTPVLLLSKVILFNWKGGLQKNQILNELALLVEVGDRVSSKSFQNEKSKFGHLHILLRDFHFQGTKDEAFAMIFNEEHKRGENIKERNKIREKLLFSFESISISIFPTPCENLQEFDRLGACPKFQDSVKQLKELILDEMNEPRCFGSMVVNAKNADLLIKKFVEELREGDINLKSVVCQLQRSIVDDAKRCFEKGLIGAYGKVRLPMKSGIENLLARERDALFKVFKESTVNVDLEDVYKDEVLEGLEQFSEREIESKRRENLLAVESCKAEQKKILKKNVEEYKASVESELSHLGRKKEMRSTMIKEEFLKCKQRLDDDFQEKAKKLGWIPVEVKEDREKLAIWVSSTLEGLLEAKRREEEYLEKSDHQERLSRAVAAFRSGVEKALHSDCSTSIPMLRATFDTEKAKLIQAYRNSTDRLHRVSGETELEKLKTWAASKLEQKVAVEEEKKRLREKEKKLEEERLQHERALQLLQQQSFYSAPSYSPATPSYSPPTPSYSPATPSYSPATPSYSPATPPSGLKFYKGGQFTPGGGRAPSGGCYMTPSPSSSRSSYSSGSSGGEATFYKGGQFTPGGGRAPSGGCYMTPSPSSSRSSYSSGSSGGGATFYKGGQFTPGGGRAPKGGCWK